MEDTMKAALKTATAGTHPSKNELYRHRIHLQEEYAATNEAIASIELKCLLLKDQLDTAIRERDLLTKRVQEVEGQLVEADMKLFKVLTKEYK